MNGGPVPQPPPTHTLVEEALVPHAPEEMFVMEEHLPQCVRGGSRKSSVYGMGGGEAEEREWSGTWEGGEIPPLSSREVVRLMLQTLQSLGLKQSAAALESESGVELESGQIVAFREAVLTGNWKAVEEMMSGEGLLQFATREDAKKAQFLVSKQIYLELLEMGNSAAALAVLRSSLGPLSQELSSSALSQSLAVEVPIGETEDYARAVRQLSSWFSCSSADVLRREAKWAGVAGGTREDLLHRLHDYIPSEVMVPEHRMSTLLRQAVLQQVRNCPLHNAVVSSISLLEDHCCVTSKLPKEPRAILDQHTDEVWAIEFSHCGGKLASASTDGSVLVWDVSDGGLGSLLQRFQPNEDVCVISFIAWSPNDQQMLLCCRGEVIILDLLYGNEVKRFSVETLGGNMHTVAWGDDGESFYCGGSEKFVKKVCIASGEEIAIWPTPCVVDMAISRDLSRLVVACQDKLVVIIDLDDMSMETLKETVTITALTLSHDHSTAALHMTNQEVHVWDLRAKIMVQRFSHSSDDNPLYYVIRPSFGGANEALILCGSECGDIHVWHRERGKMIDVIKGHTKMVNTVTWNPMMPNMFASASDDGTVRIWTTAGL